VEQGRSAAVPEAALEALKLSPAQAQGGGPLLGGDASPERGLD
jgi:hypothetical protein